MNTGFPLLDADSELLVASRAVEPYDEISRSRFGEVTRFQTPEAGFPNLDYLHTMEPDQDGWAWAAMVNRSLSGGLGLSVGFAAGTLPYLNEWKMLSEVDYVVGVEPVNTIILNRAELRRQGRLPRLEPGETRINGTGDRGPGGAGRGGHLRPQGRGDHGVFVGRGGHPDRRAVREPPKTVTRGLAPRAWVMDSESGAADDEEVHSDARGRRDASPTTSLPRLRIGRGSWFSDTGPRTRIAWPR